MTLYLKPPRGLVLYHNLETCVEERLRFFDKMTYSSLTFHNAQYLFEDSAFDRAGHFMLRLACVRNSSFTPDFIRSEVSLLKLRLDSYNARSLYYFLKTLIRHIKECLTDNYTEKITAVLQTIQDVSTKMLCKDYRTHVFGGVHVISDQCQVHVLKVPFHFCSSLIRTHRFPLQNGYVQVSCESWKELFLSLFRTYLALVLQEMRCNWSVQVALQDTRINSILNVIKSPQELQAGFVIKNIKKEVKFFPLCMLNLHNVLTRNHRLAHEERFNLSLFLKDVGVALDDSITFWKTEYSKPVTDCRQCSHSWQKDERKYVYSIRHLYGLEGARKTYKTRSCFHFQNESLTAAQEGGCPFKLFDNSSLSRLISTNLLDLSEKQIEEIVTERIVNPSGACKLYLKSVAEKIGSVSGDVNFSNPVGYFVILKSVCDSN